MSTVDGVTRSPNSNRRRRSMGDQGRRCFDGFRIDRASACVHRLADATEVAIRMLCPEDREAFLAGFEGLSRESRYFRFFTAMPRLPDSVLQRLLNTDGTDHVALAAWCRAAPTWSLAWHASFDSVRGLIPRRSRSPSSTTCSGAASAGCCSLIWPTQRASAGCAASEPR